MQTHSLQALKRQRFSFDSEWSFRLGDYPEAVELHYDDSAWDQINVPHDWSIEGEYKQEHATERRGGYLPGGIGWYRKMFNWNETWQSKKLYLEFEGIYMNSDVWINGHHLGHRPYGYIGFEYDISPYVVPGPNLVAVRVDCSQCPSSRWYSGSGIYRHTWLTVLEEVHVKHWGTYVTTPDVSERQSAVSVETQVANESGLERVITIISRVVSTGNKATGEEKSAIRLQAGSVESIHQSLNVLEPAFWSPDFPNLYKLRTEIWEDGQLLDDYETSFGIRYFRFTAEEGFTLNGSPMKFQGVCLHHDAGPVGAAVPDKLLEKRLRMLKEMGCNAIRTSHNPMAPVFYDLCDSLGILVMDEAFDGWDTAKIPYDYSLNFDEWWDRDLEDMILRDRNHPSVILWSIGNEVRKMNPATTQKLVDFVHRIDPARPVTCGINQVGKLPDANRSLLDVAGYNDGGGACFVYEADHLNHPERVMIATEAPHTKQTRGFYRTRTWWRDKNQPRIEIDDLTEEEIFFDGALQYNSSYDNSGVRASSRHSWEFVKKYPYLTGEFRWTGYDYLGESTGWPARCGNSGVIDLANFPKDHFYFYQSQFTSKPMIHMLPHWTHPGMEGVVIPVWVYTNCEEAELFLNGRSLGRKKMNEEMYLSWDVPYEQGSIKAVGYIAGQAEAEKLTETAGTPHTIRLTADVTELLPNGEDICQVSFEIVDSSGRFVPYGDNTVHLVASGPVVFLGMENGDSLDLTPAKASYRKAFYGLGMGLFQSTLEKGDIEVLAAGIIGDRVFEVSSIVSVSVIRTPLRGSLPHRHYDIYYTLDGTTPSRSSKLYEEAFVIKQSLTVRAAVYDGSKLIVELETGFVKGRREKVIDLTHGNKEYLLNDRFPGPFAAPLIGVWTDDVRNYVFAENGELYRFLGTDSKLLVGYWWYDFPPDSSETTDDAGTGEIRWNGGNVQSIRLETQGEIRLILSSDKDPVYLVRKR